MVLGDFHVHTHFSDGKLSLREVVDLYGMSGFSALAITDHLCEEKTSLGTLARCLKRTLTNVTFNSYLEQIEEEAERARKIYNMTVIPGVEITKNSFSHIDSAHIVVLGIKSFISPDLPVMDILKQIREQNALSVAAHPVSTQRWEPQTFQLWSQRELLRDHFDAWEVASGPRIFPEVRGSNLPMIASSDLHSPQQIRSWKTVIDCENNTEAILDGIRKQKVSFLFWEPKDTQIYQRISSYGHTKSKTLHNARLSIYPRW